MITTNKRTKSLRRNTSATLIVAAGAVVLGGLGAAVAAPASAADSYVALSYSLQSQVSGKAVAATSEAARIASLQNCQANGGNQCVTYAIAQNSCAALAVGTDPTLHQEWSTATNPMIELARKQALSTNGGGVIGVAGCTTNLAVDPPPLSPPSDTPPPAQPVDPTPVDPIVVTDDRDHDGLSKREELFTTHTNPFLSDTDFDGVIDGTEFTNGTNPLNPRSH